MSERERERQRERERERKREKGDTRGREAGEQSCSVIVTKATKHLGESETTSKDGSAFDLQKETLLRH